MDSKLELYKTHQQLREKYVYYICAMCVSAIGFSIYCTMGKPLQCTQILLLFAVLSWGGSIFSGLNFLKNLTYSVILTSQKLDLSKYKDLKKMPEANFQFIAEILDGKDDSNKKHLENYLKWHENLFYFGVISFICWHILQMYFIK